MRTWLMTIGLMLCGSLVAEAKDTSRRYWLLPDHVKVQYAGSIGFTSVGLGYRTRKDRLEGDFYYGYVPKSVGGDHIHAVSGKITWHPVKMKELKSFEIRPLSVGGLVSYTFGKQYFLFSPENYPYSYYGFPTAMHSALFVGGRVDKVVGGGKKIGLYYELGSTDREISSFLGNRKSLKVTEILNLALGIKTSF